MLSCSFPSSELLWCFSSLFLGCFSPDLHALQLRRVSPHCFYLHWSSFMMLSGTIPSNLTNTVDDRLFSPLSPRKDIRFKEDLILNKQQQQNPCSWNRGSVKDDNSFGSVLANSNLPVAALWSLATSVVVVTPHISSSVYSRNLESSFTFPVSFQEMHNFVLQILFHWKCTNHYKNWYQALY